MEEWRDIPGYEGSYQVSNYGRVKSVDRTIIYKNRWGGNSSVTYKGQILKSDTLKSGHLYVVLYASSIQKHLQIHQLVAKAFIPNPNNYGIVHHIDHNPQNNMVENLEWINDEEHKRLHHNVNGGNAGKPCKTVYQYSLDGELIKIWHSANDAVRELGLTQGLLCACCRGERKKHKGYKWSYEPL